MHPTSPSLAAPRWVELGPGRAVSVVDEGSGPAVLLVHGLPGSARDFRWLAPALSADHRVLRVDLPGFGRTPLSVAPSPRLEARADLLAEVMDALGLERALAAGHSMGGAVAATLAARHPRRIERLVLIASVGPRAHAGLGRHPVPPQAMSRALRLPGLAHLLRPLLRRAFEAAGFKGFDDVAMAETLHGVAAVRFDELRQRLHAVRCPTLVAWGMSDRFVEPAISEALARMVPDGPRLPIADGAHGIQKSHASEIADAMRRWTEGDP